MSFHETPRFPDEIAYRSRGGPTTKVSHVELDSGATTRNPRWDGDKHVYNARWGIRTLDDLDQVYEHWKGRNGSTHGFRYKDWYDFTTAANHRDAPAVGDERIGTGDSSETQFQLRKVYTSGSQQIIRNLVKPVAGSVVAAIAGTPTTAFTVDTTTGIITFTSPPGNLFAVTAGCEFDVPCHYGADLDRRFQVSLDSFAAGTIPDIPIEEDLGDVVTPHRYWFGGGESRALAADAALEWAWGLVVPITPSAAIDLYLPETTYLSTGGPYHTLVNLSGTYAITVRNYGDTATIATLAAGASMMTYLYSESGVKTWGAFA